MKVLLCPDKFKGTASAFEIIKAMKNGIHSIDKSIHIRECALADGGEGSLKILSLASSLAQMTTEVFDPLGRKIMAEYLSDGDTAYIEMSRASGLQLLSEEEYDALGSNTYGTGQLIKHAMTSGHQTIYLFIGGSATTDAGIGMAAALGYQFLDHKGEVMKPVGSSLSKIASINSKCILEEIKNVKFITVSDVTNPLSGPNGAAFVYAEQKGANQSEIEELDYGLENIGNVILSELGIDVKNLSGAGAAGGIGAGSVAFLNASIESGIQTMMNLTNFFELAKDCDLLITGEGRLDNQSFQGKVLSGVMRYAEENAIDWGCICGINQLDSDIAKNNSAAFIQDLVSIAGSPQKAMDNTINCVSLATQNALKEYFQ